MDECTNCGGNDILSDYFEEEWNYWCGHCGKDLTDEITQEDNYEDSENWNENNVPETKR